MSYKPENPIQPEGPSTPPLDDGYFYRFKPGEIIANRYEIVAPLGYGGFAEVYKCRDQSFDTFVAIKVIVKESASFKVREEARKTAKLRNLPHIVQVYDVAKPEEGLFYLSMQLLTNGTLEKRLDAAPFRRLNLDKSTLSILEQVGQALDYAHGKKIIHLDVKPSNVLFDENGQAFLGDFGLAQVKEVQDAARISKMSLSVDGHISGTIPYMSPELVDEKQPDYRADIYALGVMAYEMLAGQMPYRGRATALTTNISKAEPMPPCMANPELPERVGEVLLKVLSKDPNARQQSCAEFVSELAEAADAYIQVKALYEEAMMAIQAQEWSKALEKFQQVEHRAPGYKNTRLYLRDVNDQVVLINAYKKADALCQKGDFQECVETLHSLEERLSEFKPGESPQEEELKKVSTARQSAIKTLNQEIAALHKKSADLLQKNKQQEAQQLYQQAKEQLAQKLYAECQETLTQAHKLHPELEDPENIEKQVVQILKQQQRLQTLYEDAIKFSTNTEWSAALQTLSELEKLSPNYKDVQLRLATVEIMAELAELYQQAESALEKQEFEAAIQALNQRLNKNKNYEADKVKSLKTKIFDAWYKHAQQQLKHAQWNESLATLKQLQEHNPDYGDPEEIREQAHLGIAYTQAVEVVRKEEYAEALTLWLKILEQDPHYRDTKDIESRAKTGLGDKARVALLQGHYQEALKLWALIMQVDPQYPDKFKIVAQAKAKLEEQSKSNAFLSSIGIKLGDFWKKVVAQQRKIMVVGGGILGIIVIILLASMALKQCNAPQPEPTTTSTPTAEAEAEAEISITETSTLEPSSDPTNSPTPTSTPPSDEPTPTHTPTATPTATHTPKPSSDTATADRSAAIFAAPDSDSTQLSYVSQGGQVTILGRSAAGSWYFIRNDQNKEGFAYSQYFEWSGDFDALPVKAALETVEPPPENTPTTPTSGDLTMDLWPAGGRCESGGIWFRTISIAGHGGDGNYTYYWNDEKIAGPMNSAYGFEVQGAEGAIIGKGRVVSGDGQMIERNLYVEPPECSQ